MSKTLTFLLYLFPVTLFALENSSDKWPSFNPELSNVLMVAGTVLKAKYLPDEEDPRCKSGELICLDPPPIKLEIEIEKIIYGELTVKKISVFTTSHYGVDHFDIEGLPYFFLLYTDGSEFILPRYHFKLISYSLTDAMNLPMLYSTDFPSWLPCKIKELNKQIDFDTSVGDILIPIDKFDKDALDKMKDFSHISKYAVRALRGVELNDMSEYLSENHISVNNYRCKQSGN
jgi:hypothetical protein